MTSNIYTPQTVIEPAVPLAQARVLILGYGVTGHAVAGVLAGRVASAVTVDTRDVGADVRMVGAMEITGTSPEVDAAAADLVAQADLVVASPGWPPHSTLLVAAAAADVPIWSEIELAWHLRVPRTLPSDTEPSNKAQQHQERGPAPWLVLTGTNGKTTTVEMLDSILQAAGLRSAAVGNVGSPLIEAVINPELDVLAVELSSFHLHYTYSMSPHAAAILNIAPDHLDWHGSFDAYAKTKGRIFERAQVACVYNRVDPRTETLVRDANVAEGARAVGFAVGAPGQGDVGLVENILVDRAFHLPTDHPDRRSSAAEVATLADLQHLIQGGTAPAHLVANALAAAALARSYNVDATAVRDGLRAFTTGNHRIQHVATLDGVSYINDSKATNTHAASASLAGFAPGTVVWVGGGLAKGATYDDLVSHYADRLRAAVIIGVDAVPITHALERHAPQVPVVRIDPGEDKTVMQRAVTAARDLAQPGDTVLLAPAGASMDQFVSYAQRGEAFTVAVGELQATSRQP